MDIKKRSRHHSPESRAELNALSADAAVIIADGWRDNATHADLGSSWTATSHALAAYFQSIADRKSEN